MMSSKMYIRGHNKVLAMALSGGHPAFRGKTDTEIREIYKRQRKFMRAMGKAVADDLAEIFKNAIAVQELTNDAET